MIVVVTGANGFIGKNLVIHLKEKSDVEIRTFSKQDLPQDLDRKIDGADFIFHLAGVNRPQNDGEFSSGNFELTKAVCSAVRKSKRHIPIVYTSSTQAALENPYGISKRNAEDELRLLESETGSPVYIYRLPNVFGKWCRPNYNSVVATFCHNITQGLPIKINDPTVLLNLVYVDDVVKAFLKLMDEKPKSVDISPVSPVYSISVGDLAAQLNKFKESRFDLVTEPVGSGLVRALYSTYISYYQPSQFSYTLKKHEDPRGVFTEVLKTKDCGQFSFFTAHPGVTRGGHYHHTKTEKFLVVKGKALFRFLQIQTGERFEQTVDAHNPEVVETIPGWSHDITNIGGEEMIVMLWANEIFDRQNPDTYMHKVL